MFENLTLDQLAELRAALWSHYDTVYTAHSEELQTLEIGSDEMDACIAKWEARRDSIKAMQEEVAQEIKKRGPKARRVRNAE